MTSWAEARKAAHAAASPLPPVNVPIGPVGGGPVTAVGTTLAEPLRAVTAVPAFDCSAMDGYALGALGGPWRVVGRVLAGPVRADVATSPLGPREAVEVATGAAVPPGTAAVLPYELADRRGDRLEPTAPPHQGRHVRRTGEDVPLGADLLPAGTPVTPTVVGLAAAAGLDSLTVHPRARVAALLTGDELVHTGGSGAGLVRDAVGPALPGWVRALGGDLLTARPVPDADADLLTTAIRAAGGDVVLTSGGAGTGPADLVGPALVRLGAQPVVDSVDVRPGHPQRLALLPDGRWLVALPGNPYAGLVAALTLLGPLLGGLGGRPQPELPTAPLAASAMDLHGTATRILPVRRTAAGTLERLGRDRPSNLWGAALADGFAVIPPGWRGEPVALLAPPA
ncbi:MAG TPA: molybdopterin molybdotransferase MoeA [Mycobacteriales bacterium]|nr:molybdopterin molybdotransferase MoeA [Mycobacteriales bacterium]